MQSSDGILTLNYTCPIDQGGFVVGVDWGGGFAGYRFMLLYIAYIKR